MRRYALLWPILFGVWACELPEEPRADGQAARIYGATFRSKIYDIDRIYRSMKGPQARQVVRLHLGGEPELLWITGYETLIEDAEKEIEISTEFMCHSNLGFRDYGEHEILFDEPPGGTERLFTLSQGQMRVNFPKGFGVPLVSNQGLNLDTQVLNLNPQPKPLRVRHATTIRFMRESELVTPLRPLFQRAAQGMVALNEEALYYGLSSQEVDPEVHGPGCSVGTPARGGAKRDALGQEFSAHWVVPPGRQVTRTLVTEYLSLPYDTRAHFIAVHLHPYAESAELIDITTGETVYKATTSGTPNRIGLRHVDYFSSEEGIPVYADHEYELVTIYDNTSGEDQDAMSLMFLYLLDRDFVDPLESRGT